MVMLKYYVLFVLGLIIFNAQAQEASFYMSAQPDTVYLGNYTTVEITMQNLQGRLIPPDWDKSFELGGTNFSSQTQISGGQVMQKESHSYRIIPTQIGHFELHTILETDDGQIFEAQLSIVVVDNPDDIQQNQKSIEMKAPPLPKLPKFKSGKKRKIYRL